MSGRVSLSQSESPWGLVRIDPENGDREIIAHDNDVGLRIFTIDSIAVVPHPRYFLINAIPWWAAVLLVGFLIGLTVRGRRATRANATE